MTATWFSTLTGFHERSYAETQAQLVVEGHTLRSLANGRSYAIGTLETPSLADLRTRALLAGPSRAGGLRVSAVAADVAALHRDPANQHATFQVASQFNLLEMTGPEVTPEHGVTRYASDRTQGPACAMAAGAATIYRNYLVPVDDGGVVSAAGAGPRGQTHDRQVDCLRDVGHALGNADGGLWTMRNGYALCTPDGLASIAARLEAMSPRERDGLRDRLRVGVHADVQVTSEGAPADQRVTQVFASALPVAYTRIPSARWEAFATLVLEGAYEATLWAAVLNAAHTGSRVVFLTSLGGGAFGNDGVWIDRAMRRALSLVRDASLDVRVVVRSTPAPALVRLVAEFA